MELSDYITILKRHKGIIILAIVLCTAAAMLYSSGQRPAYEASVLMAVSGRSGLVSYFDSQGTASSEEGLQTALLKVRSLGLAKKVAKELNNQISPVQLTSKVSLSVESDSSSTASNKANSLSTSTIRLTITDRNPKWAVRVANVYAQTFVDMAGDSDKAEVKVAIELLDSEIEAYREQISILGKQIDDAKQTPPAVTAGGVVPLTPNSPLKSEVYAEWARLNSSYSRLAQKRDELSLFEMSKTYSPIEIIEPATFAASTRQSPFKNALFGMLAGLVIGVGAVVMLEYSDTRLRTVSDLEKYFKSPILGEVDGGRKQKEFQIVVHAEPTSVSSEAYRRLRTNINFLRKKQTLKTLLFASALSGEEEPVVLANVATSFAQTGHRVVVVCSNLRSPTLHYFFGVVGKEDKGLSDWLATGGEIKDFISDTYVEGVKIIPPGTLPSNPAELLDSSSMEKLTAFLRESFDLVFFDAPPVVEASDAVILAQKVDAVLIAARVGEITAELATKAHWLLDQVKAPLLGVIAFSKVSLRSEL